jgi:small-conductance mechanosensitive channel
MQANLQEILKQVYFDNTVERWLFAFGIALVLSVVLSILNKQLIKHFKSYTNRTHTDFDDLLVELLSKTSLVVIFVFSLLVALLYLDVNEFIRGIRKHIIIIALITQFGFWTDGLISYYIKKKTRDEAFRSGSRVTQLKAIGLLIKFVVWIVVVIFIISNLGFNVTTLITGLGIGGIAIALALQNVLGDVIASLSIIFDKPFEVGDYIAVDDLSGDVVDIGLKTTRVKSLSGEQLIFSNNDLLKSRIKNYKKMNERRIMFTLGVVYETPHEKLVKIPEILKEIITDEPQTKFDRAHFYSYGDFSLNYQIVYFVLSRNYTDYMNAQQSINLAVFKKFNEEGIEFAYPTQTLLVNKEDSNSKEN